MSPAGRSLECWHFKQGACCTAMNLSCSYTIASAAAARQADSWQHVVFQRQGLMSPLVLFPASTKMRLVQASVDTATDIATDLMEAAPGRP